jgi:hypothetical protein
MTRITEETPLLSKVPFDIHNDLVIPAKLTSVYDIDVNKYSQSFIEKIYVKFLFKALDSPIDKYDYVFKYNNDQFNENIYLVNNRKYKKNKKLYNNNHYIIIYSQEPITIPEKQKNSKRPFILKFQKIIEELKSVKVDFAVKYIINYKEKTKINKLMNSIINNPNNRLCYIQEMTQYIQINVVKK